MNTQPRHPKCRALPVELHPGIYFSAIIPRRGRKSKIFCLWSFLWSKLLLCRFRQPGKIPQTKVLQGFVAFRPALSRIPPRHSQTRRDTNFAIPGYSVSAIIPRRGRKSKIFLSVVIYVVKAAFVPLSATGESPANAGAARLCGVSPHPIPDTTTALPNHPRYQLRHTRLYLYFSLLPAY